MNEFAHFANLNDRIGAAESMALAAKAIGKSTERAKLTPEHMRALMKQWVDPLDALFDKHRWLLYQTMELAAQQNQFEAEYAVNDEETADEKKLSTLYLRMMKWAQKQGFAVSASGRALRSFIVSWDPLVTPNSISAAEARDPESVATRRLRAHRNSNYDNQQPTQQQAQHQQRQAQPQKKQYLSKNSLSFGATLQKGVPETAAAVGEQLLRNPVGFLTNPLQTMLDTVDLQGKKEEENNYHHSPSVDEMAKFLANPASPPNK